MQEINQDPLPFEDKECPPFSFLVQVIKESNG